MEDTHALAYDFGGWRGWGFFAVYDGHGGRAAADWCGAHLHGVLARNLRAELVGAGATGAPAPRTWRRVSNVLDRTFLECDEQLDPAHGVFSGCTAVVALVAADAPGARRRLFTANAGDARAVLCRQGRALRLSCDHQARVPAERLRIKDCGGLVINDRVNGTLAVSRALGDAAMKDFVTGHPFTCETDLRPADAFLILACDGLWDVCHDQQACDYIAAHLDDPQRCAQLLVAFALEQGASDNLTVLVVNLQARPDADTDPEDVAEDVAEDGKVPVPVHAQVQMHEHEQVQVQVHEQVQVQVHEHEHAHEHQLDSPSPLP